MLKSMKPPRYSRLILLGLLFPALGVALTGCAGRLHSGATLLNVSYDPTREFYRDYNAAFEAGRRRTTGQTITIEQSHGGSGKQAQAVINGLGADVVTLGIASDIDALVKKGLVARDWQSRLPDNSVPYTSTVVFLVRRGNPKSIRDWPDLIKPGVSVVTSNPKSSSGGRWSYMAAYGYALTRSGGSPASAQAFMTQLYRNVPILDSGARGSAVTFTQRRVGDVLLCWENEALLIRSRPGNRSQMEIVYPSISIEADPPVAVVDKNADADGKQALAESYLQGLYSPEAQQLAARHFYRPRLAAVARQYAALFPPIKTFTAKQVLGGTAAAQKTQFRDGGVFDQIYVKK